ncbi:hypothetical protein TIFTF001_026150 [Ficus carica]|uniref:Proteasome maturation factor UMP1 n=1 Tax=Ficus carica TaxID=3494 RepID=A0AA88DKQ1_FICCA|nr:hypothetical protein TIFTF001_026150 [Ficus carica]
MEAPKTIAHEIGGVQNDALRFGLNGVKSDIVGSHPLESAFQSVCISSLCLTVWFPRNFSVKFSRKSGPKFGFFAVGVETGSPASVAAVLLGFWTDYTRRTQEEMKRKILTNTYGSAFPLKMDLDRQILSRFQRPPGAIPSSMLGLEALTGTLDDFGFEDYLNDPRDSETFRPLDMHHGMEVRLGLSKGPVCPSFI